MMKAMYYEILKEHGNDSVLYFLLIQNGKGAFKKRITWKRFLRRLLGIDKEI